ncbi:unnamed protein product [Acanthoscelides obtectus]|uniref:Fatty acyl-CoA reductase n=4 Tax=Acanthoscelides obtectus TaxID=200917 RepID=A0A9P0M9F3_ACAOB|nr:unnamed protein product [Acanthoscelides obtectus]CAK1645883.1 Putative fatty acyl-CoA reductase CG5065 [Acanthoscelides obtectus]
MRVCEYFAGKHIFITGGSGFVGKVLIEKLLRSCPGIEKIYMLIRPKKGKDIQERLEAIVKLPLFEKLREINPDALSKIHPISGDVMELNLGMTEEDRRLVSENCHIFYHSAASVRFDDSLKYAIIMNVRGTRETAALALECKKLEAFVHISTTYCNIDREIIEEKIYPARADWRDAIRLAEETDDMNLQALTHHYIAPHPNTYTFAKSLAEHTVEDMMLGKAPTIIFRPSVVINSIREPVVGWNDNFNGPVGLLAAGGKGLLRTVYGLQESVQDYISCDIIASLLILATKETLATKHLNEVVVYNGSKYKYLPTTTGEIVQMGADLIWDTPYEQILWYPWFKMTRCWYDYYIKVLVYHMLPAVFLDLALRVAGMKPM